MCDYDFDLERVVAEIREKGYRRVAIQLPDALKMHGLDIVDFIEEKTEASAIPIMSSCYGACDLPVDMHVAGTEVLVHFGHSPMKIDIGLPVIFSECAALIEISPLVEKLVAEFEPKSRIGLVTTVQHMRELDGIKKKFYESGLAVITGKRGTRCAYEGQVLGCNFENARTIKEDVDVFLFIGSGMFHPIGIALSTGKSVISGDPYTGEVTGIDEMEGLKERFLRQRHSAITRAKECESFGILISTKPGQARVELAEQLHKKLKEAGKGPYILSMNTFEPMQLKSLDIDCYVCTGCPRIAIDDWRMYDKPIITPNELYIALGEMEWGEYAMDEIV